MINSQQVVDTEKVALKLTPVHSGGSCSAFDVKPYVRKTLHVGNDVIDVDYRKTIYSHLEPIALKTHGYRDVEMILGQDVFHSIHTLEYFESDKKFSNRRSNSVGFGFERTIVFDFRTRFDVLQSCDSK